MNYDTYFTISKIIILKPFFLLTSILFSIFVRIKNLLYDTRSLKPNKLPGLCLSIGNLSLGGSGKSPFLLFLLSQLKKQNIRAVVLTRGYKSGLTKKDILLIRNKKKIFLKGEQRKIYSDEALMYSHNFPEVDILVSPKRYEAAKFYLKENKKPDLWILDDGFSHRKLHRDFDLLLHDEALKKEKYIFPLGFLREPLSSFQRAQLVLKTHCHKNSDKKKCQSIYNIPTLKSYFQNEEPVNIKSLEKIQTKDLPVTLLSGISNPRRFIENMAKIKCQKKIILGDHEALNKKTIKLLKDSKSILTTEKDYYRDPDFFQKIAIPVFVSKLKLVITNKSPFITIGNLKIKLF